MIRTPFEDRLSAGRCLAHRLTLKRIPYDAIVIALARGGVPVGYEVADRLRLALDVIAARRIVVPWEPEMTIGAVVGTENVLDDQLINAMGLSSCELAEIVPDEIENAARENVLYHRYSPALDICGRPVIVVDDGLETGDTILAAVRCLRRARPSLVIAAAPVGPDSAFARLCNEADVVVWVERPAHLCTVGEYFKRFEDVAVDEVQKLLRASRRQQLRVRTMKSQGVSSSKAPLPACRGFDPDKFRAITQTGCALSRNVSE